MWSRLLFVFLVAAASAQKWKPNTGYSYQVQSRTLSALHQVGDQYSGMLLRANLKLFAHSQFKLAAKISQPEYANVHQAMPGGWGSPIPEQSLQWQHLDFTDKPFIIQFRNGVVERLLVEPNMPEWELNMIKGIVSQLQVDAKAENFYNSRINDLPSDDSDNAIFKTMEDTVTGKCEVLYDISPLPEYILQSHPQLVPKPSPNPDQAQTLDIVKTTNYSHCEKRPAFHFGFSGESDLEPASSKMGQFFARSSVSRVVVTGTPSEHLIQSSVTTNKVILSPTIYNNQKGMVVSRMNLTLLNVQDADAQQQWEQAEQQATLQVNDLVYDLSHPSAQQSRRHNTQEKNEQSQQQDTEEERMQGAAAQRFRRSLKPAQQQEQQQQQQQQQWRQRQQEQDSQESYESSSFEDSSISAEDWQQPRPDINQAPQIPFLPYFVGIKGQSIKTQINAGQKATEIARDVAKDLENPQVIPQKSTLGKFKTLIHLVQTMSSEELQKVSQDMFNSDENSKESKAWRVFRDAVNQAGTGPALVAMKEWIESKKVQGEEAADLLAQVPQRALTPTKQYVHLLYQITTSEVVKSQRFLNTSAILAFSNLVREAQVSRSSAHNRFPTHTFGRMNPTQAPAVTSEYIPYFAKQLRQAVREGDSVLIQTYVRALGNVAHPKILAVFEPYLEGEKQVSDFQRLHMVVALNQLVKVHPSLARTVLYRIYKTVSETPEVRSAAVYLLMKTNPPVSMLQRLAESTNSEHSMQVRSAIKSALESAAQLQAPESQLLSDNAQASIDALNNKNYGPEYSKIKLASGQVPEMNIAYRSAFTTIGSEDYLAPKAAFAHFRRILAGLKQESVSAGYMSSSTKNLINLIAAQSQKSYAQPENMEFTQQTAEQTEGNFFYKSLFGERFLAFDNHTIERLPSDMKQMLQKLSPGQTFNLQKMYNKQFLTLAFPTASGLPFVYSLMTPTIVSVEGKLKAEIKPEISSEWTSAQAAADFKILYSTRTEARMGFVAPFDSKIHVAGTDQEAQIYLPIRAEFEIATPAEGNEIHKTAFRMKVQPLKPQEDAQIAMLRSRAFTAEQNTLDLSPSEKKTVHVSKPQQWSFTAGKQETGMAFRVKATTEDNFPNYAEVLRELKNLDAFTAMAYFTEEKAIRNYEYTVTFDHDQSPAKAVLFTASYGQLEKKPGSEVYGYANPQRTKSKGSDSESETVFEENIAIPTNTSPDSEERLQQFLHKIADTMKNSRADAVDVSAQFQGERDAVYMATIAAARSATHDRLAALVYLRRASASGNSQAWAMFPSAQFPAAPFINFQKAIENKPTAFVEAKLSFGENLDRPHAQVLIKSKIQRSAQREQFVREQPISQLCQQQASHGNNFLPACQNATLAAGRMDQYAIAVKYARIPEYFENATYKAYSLARHFGWEYNTEDLISAKNSPQKIDLHVSFAPNLHSVNVSIHAPQMNAEFKDVPLSPVSSAVTVPHPNFSPCQLVSRFVLGKDYYPSCTIDKSAVNTFNNRTYPLHLDQEWYLAAQYVPKAYDQVKYSPASQIPFIKVQFRQNPAQEKEVKIFFGTQDVVEIFPRSSEQYPEIKVNNKAYPISTEPTEVRSKVDDRVFVRFYGLPTGGFRLISTQYSFEIFYDTTTFVLNIGSQYRSDVRGLCGTYGGEPATDFTAPQNCIMRDAQDFITSYTVTGDGLIKHKDLRSEPRACIFKKLRRGDVVSDYEAGRQGPQQFLQARRNQAERYTSFRTKVVEQEGQLCFSLRPLPTCNGHSQPTAQQEKVIPFHCVDDSAAARHWAKMAQKGVSLDVASKGSNKNLTIKVPESCQA